MGEMYGSIMAKINTQGLQMAGPPFSHYLSYDEETGITECLVGFPTTTRGKNSEEIEARSYPEIEVIQAMHTGPYEEIPVSYGKLMEHVEANQIDVKYESFEFYYTDPESEPNITKWQTLIAFPLK